MPKSSQEINQQLRGTLSDLWSDCWRQGQPFESQKRLFDERLKSAVHDATDHKRYMTASSRRTVR